VWERVGDSKKQESVKSRREYKVGERRKGEVAL